MRSNILSKLARFNRKFNDLRYRNPNLNVRYVLSQEAYDEILKHAIYCMNYHWKTNGKNYIFGVEFRVDPDLKGIIMAEVEDDESMD